MTTHVLFLCPHGAAKSTSSVAFLRRAADELGLNLEVRNAGTDPDAEVHPIVQSRLDADELSYAPPVRLTDADLDWADLVVNIGCDLADHVEPARRHDWTIPDFSADPAAAFTAIEAHVTGLATGLSVGDSQVWPRSR